MKIRIEKEVSIASAFTHLIAAWDYRRLPWYRKVEYTRAGRDLMNYEPKEPRRKDTVLAIVTMDDPAKDDKMIIRIDGRWIEQALTKALGDKWADDAAMQIINEDPAADQNTADLVMQMGAYGRIVFG